MAMEKTSDKPECAQQALDLLNCVTQSPFDQDKCLHLLNALRECVVSKVFYFSISTITITITIFFLIYSLENLNFFVTLR